MLADGLTKTMTAPKLMQFLSTGFVELGNMPKHSTLLRRLPILEELHEEDLTKDDETIWREAREGRKTTTMKGIALMTCLGLRAKHLAAMIAFSTMLPTCVEAHESFTGAAEESSGYDLFYMFIMFYTIFRLVEFCFWKVLWSIFSTSNQSAMSPSVSRSSSKSTSKSLSSERSSSSESRPTSRRLNLDDEVITRQRKIIKTPPEIWITEKGDTYRINPTCNGTKRAKTLDRERICKFCDRTQSSSGV
jgi:hypothetical protein